MNNLLKKAVNTHTLEKNELIFLLENNELDTEIFQAANRIRQENVGDKVHLRGLIEFSNICARNCKYCGLRCDNKNIERYSLEPKTVLNYAKFAKEHGIKTVVLQSGEDNYYTIEKMQKLISELKKLDLAVTLSLGEKTYEEYKSYKEAGADRYLIRIETTDENLYKKMHPKMDYANRVRCLKDLKKLNYEIGSGSLVGLPEQTLSSLADDLLFFKNLQVDMAGIGPFIPNPDTPLKNADGDNFRLSLKVMALMRLLLPKINIPATTAMEALNPNGRIIALQSGANVVMPNVTEGSVRKKYLIYPGKVATENTSEETLSIIKSKIESISRPVSTDFGTSLAYKKD